MMKTKSFKLFFLLGAFLFLSGQTFAQEEEEEGPEAPPAPIEDWIPFAGAIGLGYAMYVISKKTPAQEKG